MDYFSQEIESKPKDYFSEEIQRTPSDSSKEMQDAKWGTEHPYARAMQNTMNQSVINPLVQSANAIAPAINGISKGMGFPEDQNTKSLEGPDMSNAPFAAKVLGDVAGGAIKGTAATLAGGGNPLIGFGALSGLEAYGKGENPLPEAIKGSISAIPQALAGKLGSSLASAAAKPFGGLVSKFAPNVGTALGMGGASATMAPDGDKLRAAATGGAFGVLSPMNPIGSPKNMTQSQYEDLAEKHGNTYRDVLNPGKGIINKVEIKSGKDINDSFKLAAKEGLIINKDATGKLDTTGAIEQLKDATAPLYDQQNDILSSNSDKQFNLDDLGTIVKDQLKDKIKNGSDLETAKSKVDNEINAEILRHGENVDANTLNMIKQGMWSKSYNPLEPNANDTARQIGFAAKDAIESAFPNETIKENNSKIGDYLQLQKILEKSHGQIVKGGKIGKYLAKGSGALVGAGVGAHVPIMGEILGPLAGSKVGGAVNDFINDPQRITSNIAKEMKNINITDPITLTSKRPGVAIPQVLNPNGPRGLSSNNITPGIAAPLPQYLKDRQNIPPIRTGGEGNQVPINMPHPYIKLPAPQSEYLKERQSQDIPSLGVKGNSQEISNPKNPMQISKIERRNTVRYMKNPPPGAIMDLTPSEESFGGSQNPINPSKNPQQGINANSSMGAKVLGVAGAVGLGSVLNPMNSQAQDTDRLNLPSPQYTQKEEGFKGMPYMDTKGNKTVGYGFKMDGPASKYIPQSVHDGKRALTKEEATGIFNKLYPQAVETAQKFSGENWNRLSNNQKKSLTDMAYQLGSSKLNNFKNLKEAVQRGHFNTAAREILNSDYANDAKNRAQRNSQLILS